MPRFPRSALARLALIGFSTFVTLSFFSRLLLLGCARHDIEWGAQLVAALVTGIGFDMAAGFFAALPWILFGALVPESFLKSRSGRWLVTGLLLACLTLLIFITTAECVFWGEFGARFNFIAVDYLIWTQEVLGNIAASYPMVAITTGIVALAALATWAMVRAGVLAWVTRAPIRWTHRVAWPLAGIFAALAVSCLSQQSIPSFTNNFNVELAKNGCWSFFAACRSMEIDFQKWYAVLPEDQVLPEAKQLLATPAAVSSSPDPADFSRHINGHVPEHRWNVILVCMESMSGEYMSYVGKNSGLTPNLDRLAKESIFFKNLYATGTRTVRGMEALTLNLPPTPGQAIIYRPDGINLTTTFSAFSGRGYDCAFLYGGDGRFDFMNRYFSTAGCRIVDVGAWNKDEITYKTPWGACDEDLFSKTIQQADADHAAGKPFHFFCMTTSNHRPYAFPSGRIDPANKGKRESAVEYADWAIGDLIARASQKQWCKDTLFVIVADHCASSAGKTEIDVTKYRIPGMIYNPALVAPKVVGTLASQIDVMPTMFGLLGWNYETLSYGHDLLDPANAGNGGRAFVSNYQKLGMLTDDGIAILSPNRKSAAYTCDLVTGAFSPPGPAAESMIHDTTVFYQSASWLFKSGRLRKDFRKPAPLVIATKSETSSALPTTPKS